MRYGFNAHARPPEEYLDYAATHGLKHIEICLIKTHSALASFDGPRVDRLANAAADAGVTLSLHAPYSLDLPARMPLARRNNIAYLKKALALAGRLRATHITLHLGQVRGFPLWPWKRQQSLEGVSQVLRKLLPVCEAHGVPLALENAAAAPPRCEGANLGDNIDDFKFLFEAHASDGLGLCVDTGHANTNTGAIAFIEELGDRVVAIHCHDNEGDRDQHLAVGKGSVPWHEVGAALRGIDFDGPCICECFDQEPHETAALLAELFDRKQ